MQKKIIKVDFSLIDELSDLRTKLYNDIVLQKPIFDMLNILDKAESELKQGKKKVAELEKAAKTIGDSNVSKIANNYDQIMKTIEKQINAKKAAISKIPDL